MTDEIKKAAGYIRVSTAEQAMKGLSLETQEALILDYIAKNKMKAVGLYIDKGITARKKLEKRTEFMRMMNDIDNGLIDHIVVLRLDRWFRNVYDYHRMMNQHLIPHNVNWSAVNEEYDTTTTNGRLMINLRLAIAEQECDTDSDRVKDIFTNIIHDKRVINGNAPYGYKIVDKRLVIDEEKEPIVRDIFETYKQYGSIAQTTKVINSKYGLTRVTESYRKVLINPMYKGEYREVKDYCPAYITDEEYQINQRMMQNAPKFYKQTKNIFIFSSMLICSECNHRLTATRPNSHRKNKGYVYYRCENVYDGLCNSRKRIREDYIEDYLLNNAQSALYNYIYDVELKKKNQPSIVDNRKQIDKKLKKLNELYINDYITMEEYKERYNTLQSQIIFPVDDGKKISLKPEQIKYFLSLDLSALYEKLTLESKRRFWRSYIKSITIKDGKINDISF